MKFSNEKHSNNIREEIGTFLSDTSTDRKSVLFLNDGPGVGKTAGLLKNINIMLNAIFLFETHDAKTEMYKEYDRLKKENETNGPTIVMFSDFIHFIKHHRHIEQYRKTKYIEEIKEVSATSSFNDKTKKINSILRELYEENPEVFSVGIDEERKPLDYISCFILTDKKKLNTLLTNDEKDIDFTSPIFLTYDKLLNNSNIDMSTIKNKTIVIDENIADKIIEEHICSQSVFVSVLENNVVAKKLFPKNIAIKLARFSKKMIKEAFIVMSDMMYLTDEEYTTFIDILCTYTKKVQYTRDDLIEEFKFLQSEVVYVYDMKIYGIKIKKLPSVKNGNRYIIASADMDTFNRKLIALSVGAEYSNTYFFQSVRYDIVFKPKVAQVLLSSSKKAMINTDIEIMNRIILFIDNKYNDTDVNNIITHKEYIGAFNIVKNMTTKYISILYAKGTNTAKGEFVIVYGTPIKNSSYYLNQYAVGLLVSHKTYKNTKSVSNLLIKNKCTETRTIKDKVHTTRRYKYDDKTMQNLEDRDVAFTLNQSFGRNRQNLFSNAKIVYVGEADISSIAKITDVITNNKSETR